MKRFRFALSIACVLWAQFAPAHVPVAAASLLAGHATQRGSSSTQESIFDALAEAIPLGKETVRSIAKPILDNVVITPDEEMEIGDKMYGEVRKRFGTRLDSNRRDVEYVNAVGRSLAANVQRRAIRYRFHVVEEAIPNAFAIPGGHIFIYRGLLDKVIQNEAQLAEVVAHEIAHVDAGHTIDFFKPIKAAAQFPLADVTVMLSALAAQLLKFTYGEVHEMEADRLGTVLAFRANYEVAEGAKVHRRLAALKKDGTTDPVTGMADALMRTHPPSEKRAVAIEAQAQSLRQQNPNWRTYIGLVNYQRRIPISVRAFD
jgi:predicted Zn-dependent protease